VTAERAGVYLHPGDVYNIMHAVWLPVLSPSHRKGAVTVMWLAPGDDGDVLRGPADPAGEIGLRVQDAPGRCPPVPLERWPGYSSSRAAGAPRRRPRRCSPPPTSPPRRPASRLAPPAAGARGGLEAVLIATVRPRQARPVPAARRRPGRARQTLAVKPQARDGQAVMW